MRKPVTKLCVAEDGHTPARKSIVTALILVVAVLARVTTWQWQNFKTRSAQQVFRTSTLTAIGSAQAPIFQTSPDYLQRRLHGRPHAAAVAHNAGKLAHLGWREPDLAAWRKHDPDKVQLAQGLRGETTFSVGQIAERPHLDTPKSASFCVLNRRRQERSCQPSQFQLRLWMARGKMQA